MSHGLAGACSEKASEAPAEDHLDDQPVGGMGEAEADAKVDLPARVHVEVNHGVDLLLLLAGRVEVPDNSEEERARARQENDT